MADKMAASSSSLCRALCRSPAVLVFLMTSLFFSGYHEKGYLFALLPSQQSVMSGRFPYFLGGTSTKLWIKCLGQGHNTVTPVSLELVTP